MLPPRQVSREYADPLDRIWLATARALGLSVVRSDDAFAATDGRGIVKIATTTALDSDDSLAQMIFHEICHWLTEGVDARHKSDWGLDNETDIHHHREHGCLRLQATLARRYGLGAFFAPTTDFRAYYDALGDCPLEPKWDPSVALAIAGLRLVDRPPFAPHLELALARTRAIADIVTAALDGAAPQSGSDLWATVAEPPARHRTGLPGHPAPTASTCGNCAWHYTAGKKAPVSRCRQAGGARTGASEPACERFEPHLDCQHCGACCREAYHSVTIPASSPFIRRHPELVVVREAYTEIRREGDRCAALGGGVADVTTGSFEPYACRHYDDRPSPCRGFTAESNNCLTARRRVSLSL